MKDMLGNTIKDGDPVAFGQSDRHNPINVGIVEKVEEGVVYILAKGNCKLSPISYSDKVIVLPKDYEGKCRSVMV